MSDILITAAIDSSGAQSGSARVQRSLEDIRAKAREMKRDVASGVGDVGRQVKQFNKDLGEIVKGTDKASAGASQFARAAKLVVATLGIRELVRYADTYTNIESKLRVVTRSTQELTQTQERLLRVSNETRSGYDATATLYARVARNANNLGLEQEKLFKLTETVNKSILISGNSAQEASAGIIQLSQALSAGTLQGDELRSVLENMPVLATAIATGLGVTTGELRKLGSEGRLTAKQVAEAILSQSSVIEQSFLKVKTTIAGAFTVLGNNLIDYLGNLDKATGASEAFSGAILAVAENIDSLVKVGLTLAGLALPLLFARVATAVKAAAAAFELLTIAIALNPIGALVTVLSAAVVGLVVFRDELQESADSGNILAQALVVLPNLVYDFYDAVSDLLTLKIPGWFDSFIVGAAGVGNALGLVSDRMADALADEAVDRRTSRRAPRGKPAGLNPRGAGGRGSGGAGSGESAPELESKIDAFEEALKALREEGKLLQINRDLRGEEQAIMEVQTQLARDKKQLTSEQEMQLREAYRQVQNIRAEEERMVAAAEEWNQIIRNANEEMQDVFRETFRDIFNGGVDSFGDLASRIKGIFISLAAEIATLMFFKPFISGDGGGVAGSILGSLGLGGGASGGSAGGLGGIGGIGDIFSAGSALFSGGGGSILPAGLAGYVDDIGSFFGITGGVAQGPTLSGAAGYNLGASSNFTGGAALAGIGGAMLADALGLGGGIGGSIGGTVGGLAGSFFGPVGAGVGSFLGTAIGGLFGGKKPSSKMQTGVADLSTGMIGARGGLTGKKFSQENYDTVTNLGAIAASISQSLGATNAPLSLAASDRYGYEYAFGNDLGVFDADSAARVQDKNLGSFLEKLTNDLATNYVEDLSSNVSTALQNIEWGDTEESIQKAISDLGFAAAFEKIGEQEEPIRAVQAALDQLAEAQDTAADRAERLGLSTEKVAAAFDKVRDSMREDFDTALGRTILEIVDPVAAELAKEQERYMNELKDAEILKADLAQVELLHLLRKEQILQRVNKEQDSQVGILSEQAQSAASLISGYASLANSLGATIQGLRLGGNSKLSTEERLREGLGIFDSLVSAGGLENSKQAEQLSGELLSLASDYYGATAAYAAIFDKIEGGLTGLRVEALEQVDTQEAILSAANRQIAVLEAGFMSLADAIAGRNTKTDVFTGGAMNAAGVSLSSTSGAFGLSVGQVEAIGRSITGYTGATGNGQLQAALNSGGMNAQFEAALKAAAGIPGYATGGSVPAFQRSIVGENGPELVESAIPLRVSPLSDRASMRRVVGNDNSRVEALLQEMVYEIRMLGTDIANSNMLQAETQERVTKTLGTIESTIQRARGLA